VRFGADDAAVIAVSAAFWSVLNATFAPLFWQATRLPIFCDLLAAISLILAAWWVRKLGAATLVGLLATVLNFILRSGALYFLGFTAASAVFDALTRAIGYERCFSGGAGPALLATAGTASTWVAGLIIGALFMGGSVPLAWFSALHAAGGLIGSLLGVALVKALERRIARRAEDDRRAA
jgi:hypothetical protein